MNIIAVATSQSLWSNPEPGLFYKICTVTFSGWSISFDIPIRSLLRRDDRRAV